MSKKKDSHLKMQKKRLKRLTDVAFIATFSTSIFEFKNFLNKSTQHDKEKNKIIFDHFLIIIYG